MRRLTSLSGLGLALIATPVLADPGAHHGAGAEHFLIQHGMAAGLIAIALGAAALYFVKRKG